MARYVFRPSRDIEWHEAGWTALLGSPPVRGEVEAIAERIAQAASRSLPGGTPRGQRNKDFVVSKWGDVAAASVIAASGRANRAQWDNATLTNAVNSQVRS